MVYRQQSAITWTMIVSINASQILYLKTPKTLKQEKWFAFFSEIALIKTSPDLKAFFIINFDSRSQKSKHF